jgi:DNA-binding MarR family transcriptional regulator
MIIELTSAGKKRARNVTGRNREYDIMRTLDENGPSSIDELAEDLRASPMSVKRVASKLAEKGFVTKGD